MVWVAAELSIVDASREFEADGPDLRRVGAPSRTPRLRRPRPAVGLIRTDALSVRRDQRPTVQDLHPSIGDDRLHRFPGERRPRIGEALANEIRSRALTQRVTPAWRVESSARGAGSLGSSTATVERSASANRSAGSRPPQDWCGRSVLYSTTQASNAACSWAIVANSR